MRSQDPDHHRASRPPGDPDGLGPAGEAGTQVGAEKVAVGRLRVEGLGDADLRVWLEAAEQARRQAEAQTREMACGWEASEVRQVTLEGRPWRGGSGGLKTRVPPSPKRGDFEGRV